MANDDFQARLERLKNADTKQPARPPKTPKPKPQGRSLVRRIQIWGIGFLLTLVGVAYLNHQVEGGLREQMAQMGTDLKDSFTKSSDGKPRFSAIPTARPKSVQPTIEQKDQGTIMRSPAVLAAAGQTLEASDLFSDFEPGADLGIPSKVDQFQGLDHCKPRRPTKDEKIIGVRISAATMPTQIHAIDKASVARALTAGLKPALKHRRKIRLGVRAKQDTNLTTLGQSKAGMNTVDVVLTDTSAPLYLLLQISGGQMIWNLHLAPGVQLKHVVMISGGKVALSGLPSGVSYQYMRTGDFVTKHHFGVDDTPRDCMILPWRNPQPNWGTVQKAARRAGLFRNQMESFTKGYAAFNRWYKGAIGQDAAIGTMSALSAAHVLLGPEPTQKLPYHTIHAHDLLISKTDYVITGAPESRAQQMAKLHTDLFFSALGADIETLWPDPMERPK